MPVKKALVWLSCKMDNLLHVPPELTPTEQRYAQIENECLAIVFACDKLYQCIHDRECITVHSDHKPMEVIFKKSLLTAPKRLQRMLLWLQRYQLQVQYKPVKLLNVADFLSRTAQPDMTHTQMQTPATVYAMGLTTEALEGVDQTLVSSLGDNGGMC